MKIDDGWPCMKLQDILTCPGIDVNVAVSVEAYLTRRILFINVMHHEKKKISYHST